MTETDAAQTKPQTLRKRFKIFLKEKKCKFVNTCKYITISIVTFVCIVFGFLLITIGSTCANNQQNCSMEETKQVGLIGSGVTIIIMAILMLIAYTLFKKYRKYNKLRYILVTIAMVVVFMVGLGCIIMPSVLDMNLLSSSLSKSIGIVLTASSTSILIFVFIMGMNDACGDDCCDDCC